MKVKDLIEKLKQVNQKADVFLSSDAEGNSFHGIDKDIDANKEKDGQVILWADDQHLDMDEDEFLI